MIARHPGVLRRLLPAVLAFAGALTAFTVTVTAAPAPAPVRAADGYYVATLATPVAAPLRSIEGGLMWSCAGDSCAAARDSSRPAIVCARLAMKRGAVTRFATPGGDLAAEDLAKCNSAAH